MATTAIAIADADPGGSLTVTPTSLTTDMSVGPLGVHGGVMQVKNADTTHALSVVFAKGTGPEAATEDHTVTVAANTTGYIALPETGPYGDDDGLLQITMTPATGGALTGSTAVVLVPKLG